jgi:leucyl aminopeptidase (aminopeptidase T)
VSPVDERISRYADVLLDTCLGVQPGWQVLVWGTPLGRPLLEVVMARLAERGAYPLLRLTFGGGLVYHHAWLRHAPPDVIARPAPIEADVLRRCDAVLAIGAPEDTRAGADIAAERTSAVAAAYRPVTARLDENEVPWLMCWYPTPALAADAGMTLAEFEDFLYGACLVDWEAEHARISTQARCFDAASEVRIAGAGTDLVLSIAGRRADVDAGFGNMPGGELFLCPVETRPRARSPSRSSRRYGAAAGFSERGCALPRASSSTRRRRRRRRSCWRRSTPTRVRAGSASSGSAATPASTGTSGTCTSTRRSTAQCTSRSDRASPTWAA